MPLPRATTRIARGSQPQLENYVYVDISIPIGSCPLERHIYQQQVDAADY
jgi:hypothetical protein